MQQAEESNSTGADGESAGKSVDPTDDADPAVAAFQRWRKIEDEPPDAQVTKEQEQDWLRRSVTAELALVLAVPTTQAGLAAKLKMVESLGDGGRHNRLILRQVISALEGRAA